MYLRLIVIACCFCFWECDSAKTNPTPSELTIQFINQLRPQLVGTWQRLIFLSLVSLGKTLAWKPS
jgi:hypothetical protein